MKSNLSLPACVLALGVAALLVAVPARANPIERACLASASASGDRTLCSCVGQVAQRTLTGSQMREGARFFTDPERAQDVRQSDRRRHEELWRAWRDFGEAAEATCS